MIVAKVGAHRNSATRRAVSKAFLDIEFHRGGKARPHSVLGHLANWHDASAKIGRTTS
jgi:hypothetical protein